jgi:hypothetical protein
MTIWLPITIVLGSPGRPPTSALASGLRMDDIVVESRSAGAKDWEG